MDLSIVIPFLNEGNNLVQTIKNIRSYYPNIDIIVINDGSDDNFDYSNIDCKLITNSERKGVAESREIGISQVTTNNVLVLDAHMKFYEGGFVEKMVNVIEQYPNTIFCARTRRLDKDFNEHPRGYSKTSGAYFSFDCPTNGILQSKWVKRIPFEPEVIDIPCVLGASYFFNVEYFKKLRGLEGLKMWGCDEFYLSLKSWLSGGSCKLLNSVSIGHIFNTHSYPSCHTSYLFNKLWVAKTCLPDAELYINLLRGERGFKTAYKWVCDESTRVKEYRKYYLNLFTRPISYIHLMNDVYFDKYKKKG